MNEARTVSAYVQPNTQQLSSLSSFRESVSTSFVPLAVSSEAGERFKARITATDADSVSFTEMAAKPHLVERTSDTIAQGGSGYFKVTLMMSGQGFLLQDGKELLLRPGDLSLYDTSRPYSLLFDDDFRAIIMMFSKDRLNLPIAAAEQLTAVSLDGTNAPQQFVSAFLSQFPSQLLTLNQHVRNRLAHTSLELMSTLASSVLDLERFGGGPRRQLLQRIYDFIDQHLGSADLSPTMIAEAHFISLRHLHSLFSEAGTTVSTWVREQRLTRCKQDLVNPMYANHKIASIAARWGFTDAAHFSRVFKEEFGLTPRQLRQELLATQP